MSQLQDLTNKLIEVSSDWNRHDLVPDQQKAECRVIGMSLNKLGGVDAMQTAYYAAKTHNRCASVIQAYWDGIGDWRW